MTKVPERRKVVDPSSRSVQREALIESIRRASSAKAVNFDELLFPEQRAFVEDPARFKAAICGRRAGKSEGISHLLLKEGLKRSNVLLPYITLTTMQGKRILWPVLKRLNYNLQIGAKFNENDLTCKLPNGSEISIIGGSEGSELERLRGPKYPGVVFDEAQSFGPHLEQVIREIVRPATMDYQDSWIALTGTPNAACAGYFYELTTGRLEEEISVHHWTAFDNPYIRNPETGERYFEKWIAAEKKRLRWDDSNAVYQREWLGMWVRDDSSVIYKIRPHNLIQALPEADDWAYVLGVDLGFKDATAFVVLAYSVEAAKVVVIESYSQSGLIPSAVAMHIEKLRETYDFEAIVADEGGFGKGYAEEARQRYSLPIQAAEKSKKNIFIEHLNGDLHAGVLFLIEHANRNLIAEAHILQWRADSVGKPSDIARKEDPSFENHLADAMLYGYRYCRQYMHENEENPPKRGTPEWDLEQEDAVEAAAVRSYAKANANWWETDDATESAAGFDEDLE